MRINPYGLAIVLIVGLTALNVWALGYRAIPSAILVLAVAAPAWLGGIRPGLVGLVGTTIAYVWLFVNLPLEGTEEVLRLGGWILTTALIWLGFSLTNEARTSERIARQQASFRAAVLRSMPDGVLISDAKGAILDCNERMNQMFGYENLRGQHISVLIPDSLKDRHATLRQTYYQHPEARPMGVGLELFGRRRDGTLLPVEISLAPLLNTSEREVQVVSVVRDITARRVLEREQRRLDALRLAEQRQRARLVDMASDAIIVIDLESRTINEWNPAATRLYGWEREEALGQRADRLLWAHDNELQASLTITELLRVGYAEGDWVVQRKDGQRLIARTRLNLIETADGSRQVLSISNDRTLELRVLAEQQARAEAEAAIRLRDDFLSVAAHELKTPLTTLRGFSEMLMSEFEAGEAPNPERARRAASRIRDQTQRLDKLIGQLLDISRIGAGRVVLTFVPTDLREIIEDSARRASIRDRTRKVTYSAPAWPVIAQVDAGRMDQVLSNLLDNAIKFSYGDIEIRLKTEGDTAIIGVRDYGPGVPPEERERIFARSFTADPRSASSGLGLGLYISHEIVSLHGGTIWVEDPADQQGGAMFQVRLPLSTDEGAA